MSTFYEVRYACHPQDFSSYGTARIRNDFLISGLMVPDQIRLCYSHYDRFIAGGIVPVRDQLTLETIDPLKSTYFLERRELGIINVGGKGIIVADGKIYELGYKEALYIGMGVKDVQLSSSESANPAKFYLNSAPAHHAFPTRKIALSDAEITETGSQAGGNSRSIIKLIV